MLFKTCAGILFVGLIAGVLGCDKDTSSPTAPTARSAPTATNPAPAAGGLHMSGTVFDTAFRPLAGATVEVLDGPQSGLSTTANGRGQFSLTGAFDEATRFRATAKGHVTATRTLQPFCERCNPNWWINFDLEVPDSPVNVGGDYVLTFVAGTTCTMLPDEMRSRTFTATIPVTSPALPDDAFFPVGGATLFEDWNTIGIGVAGDYVALWLETLVEQVAPNVFVSFAGEAAAVVDPSKVSTFVLPFQGSIGYCVTNAENGRYPDCFQGRATTHRCESNHQLRLTRR